MYPEWIQYFSVDFPDIDDDFYEELEEILIMGDIGVNATEAILDDLKEKVKEQQYQGADRVQGSF